MCVLSREALGNPNAKHTRLPLQRERWETHFPLRRLRERWLKARWFLHCLCGESTPEPPPGFSWAFLANLLAPSFWNMSHILYCFIVTQDWVSYHQEGNISPNCAVLDCAKNQLLGSDSEFEPTLATESFNQTAFLSLLEQPSTACGGHRDPTDIC